MLQGVGNGGTKADTRNPEAQAWFDQGLNLYHAFNHDEARDAFARAAAADPNCALCEWGVALGLGPTLNYGITPQQRAEALAHAQRAKAMLEPGEPRTAALIQALLVRYGRDTPDDKRETLYGAALYDLAQAYPDDNEVANLAAHALLIPARHDDVSGVPKAEALLKAVLARKPDDTAAIHYYIHATEFGGHAADALPYAERLVGLAPGASHLVHMGAHTMMRVGQYEDVAVVDAEALKVDAQVATRLGYGGPLSARMYYLHNYSFGLAGALMAGDRDLSLKYADHAAVAFPASFDRGTVSVPAGASRNQTPRERRITASARALVALGRYDPARALAAPERPDDQPIQRIYRHYARGEAFAARGDAAGVAREAQALAALKAEAQAAKETGNIQIADIAGGVLAGRAAMLSGHADDAARLFAAAAAAQEKAFPVHDNFDPPPWWYPVRRSLAAAHLKAGRPADAAREAQASLKDWPQDALALRVLAKAEAKLGNSRDARQHLAEARRTWRGDLAKTPLDLT
jgi:hypothetical protein